MSLPNTLRKLQAYKKNPDLIKEVSNTELADLVLIVMRAVEAIDQSIESKRLNVEAKYDKEAKTLLDTAEKQYSSLIKEVTAEVNRLINTSDTVLSTTATELERRVQTAIENIRNGNDGIITEAEIARAAEMASMLIEMPDFDALVTEHLTKNANATRDGLESIQEEEDKLAIDAIGYLRQELDDLASKVGKEVAQFIGGGVSEKRVRQLITEFGGSGSVSDTAYGASWDGDTTTAPSKNAVYDKIETLAGGHDPVTVTDTDDIDITLTGQDITASLKATAISAKTLDTLAGTEELLVNDAGTLKKTTAQDIADLAAGGVSSVNGETGAVTISTTDLDGTAHRLLYTDGSGNVTELAFGTDGQVLTSTGTTTAPAFETPSGGGNTYFNNQFIDQTPDGTSTYGALGGTVNGVNAVFTVSQAVYATGTLMVYVNGVLQNQNGDHNWTETTPASGTFTFEADAIPQTGDVILVTYQTAELSADTVMVVGGNVSDLTNDAGYLTTAVVADGDKGDITVSASGATWTIDNGVVTLAKQADMATASVVYRKTAGSGAPEVQTLATLKTDLGLTGTNSGDQTTIVGITGTKAQFDTAVTDGNFMYIGDAPTSHTHLLAAGATDVTASAAELNILDGATLTTTELNYVDGVTSAIQTQLDNKLADTTPFIKSITFEDPTATEDITIFFTDDAITVTQLNAVVRGTSPSVTWTIRHSTDRSATGNEVVTSGTTTTSVSTGSEVTSFNDATIPAGSWVWLETTAESGTTDELSVSIEYTRD